MNGQGQVARIDDTDPRVKYVGPWEFEDGKQYDSDASLTNGKTFNSTLHALRADGSFSIEFEGSSGKVVGTNAPNAKPSWTCAIDGVRVLLPPPPSGPTNNWVLCEWSAFPGTHNLTMNISIDPTDAPPPFLLDYVSYSRMPGPTPYSSSSDTLIETIEYPLSDPSFNFDNSWVPRPPHGMSSGSGGSRATLTFYGFRLEVLGFIPKIGDDALNATAATYSLDNEDPIAFDIVPSSQSDSDFHQFILITNLSDTVHTLAITYSGNSSTVPLILDTLLVTTRSSPYGTGWLASPNPLTALVVGGTLGGVFVVLALGFGIAWTKRRRRVAKADNAAARPFTQDHRQDPLERWNLFRLFGANPIERNGEVRTTMRNASQVQDSHPLAILTPIASSPAFMQSIAPTDSTSTPATTFLEHPPLYTPT